MRNGPQRSSASEAPGIERRTKAQRVTRELVVRELRTHDFGILSTASAEGKPYSAGVNYGVSHADDGLAIYVMTRRHLRKARNVAGNPHISLVVPLPIEPAHGPAAGAPQPQSGTT